jgi:hypothetical protein
MRWLAALLLCLIGSDALAQNVFCPTRPAGDSSNACASTAFTNTNVVIPNNNTGNAITLTTPNPTSATYDTTPIASIFINQPAAATTRNFISGIWVQTNAATTDKGRGIAVNNLGASDSIYVQNDGVGSTGLAILNTALSTNATGGVIGTLLSNQTALILRQETAINPSAASTTLLQVQADGALTEMMRVNSSVASQVGTIYRMTGANAVPITILNPSLNNTFQVNNNGGIVSGVNGGAAGILLMNGSTTGSTTLSVNATGSLTVDGSAGLSVTKTVRAAGGASDCTLIFTKGLLTGGTC